MDFSRTRRPAFNLRMTKLTSLIPVSSPNNKMKIDRESEMQSPSVLANLHLTQSISESFFKAGIVFDWYHTVPSRRIDLFEDYAGNELF